MKKPINKAQHFHSFLIHQSYKGGDFNRIMRWNLDEQSKTQNLFLRYYRIEKTEMAENLTRARFSRGLKFPNRMARFRLSLWCPRR